MENFKTLGKKRSIPFNTIIQVDLQFEALNQPFQIVSIQTAR